VVSSIFEDFGETYSSGSVQGFAPDSLLIAFPQTAELQAKNPRKGSV
jgi:hypothetical protein